MRLQQEKEAARKAVEADRRAALERVKATQAEIERQRAALKAAEERAQREAEARAKAEREARAMTQSEREARAKAAAEVKAREEAEAARLAAEQARRDAEAKTEAERQAAEAKAREAVLKANAMHITKASMHADRGEYDAAFQELDQVKVGRDGRPRLLEVGGRIVQKETAAAFEIGDDAKRLQALRHVLARRDAYLSDKGRSDAQLEVFIIEPPEGMEYVDKNGQGYHEFRSLRDDAVMVFVPAGRFTMGSPSGDPKERPAHIVQLDAYLIDKTEVTVGQFRRFVEATRYITEAERAGGADVWAEDAWDTKKDASWKKPYFEQSDDYPVTCVSWNDATAYCQWAGKRLPSEAEWEMAARGHDGRNYPWGNAAADADGDYRCNAGPGKADADDYATTAPVGSYEIGASPYGLMDMAGNVTEWCADWYEAEYYAKSPPRNPTGPAEGHFRIRRGGAWFSPPSHCRVTCRVWSPPVERNCITGFRSARSVR
jgi:formylglycine-generating enzyme required for sulfatase activity